MLATTNLPERLDEIEPSIQVSKPTHAYNARSCTYYIDNECWTLVYRAVVVKNIRHLEWRIFRDDLQGTVTVHDEGTLKNKRTFKGMTDEALEKTLPVIANYHTINKLFDYKSAPKLINNLPEITTPAKPGKKHATNGASN